MSMKHVYLDHNATTPLSNQVQQAIIQSLQNPELQSWGNPSSIHWAGRRSKTILRTARQNLAKYFGVHPLELVFTSGGSESNNTILQAVLSELVLSGKNEVITTRLEHPSVIKTLQFMSEKLGVKIHYLSIDLTGRFPFSELLSYLNSKTALVSIMAANNETGLIFPIREITEMVHAHGALMHSDCVQAFGKIAMSLNEWGVDYASISAHKFYGLKGTGVLFAKKNKPFSNLIFGGGQERYRRGGTENVLGILSLLEMSQQLSFVEEQSYRLKLLRDQMEEYILKHIPEIRINHQDAHRLSNTSNFLIDGIDGETLLMSLDLKGYAVSTGAACSSGNPEPSPVLLALGLTRAQAQTSLRVSLGWGNTTEEVQDFSQTLASTVQRLRHIHQQDLGGAHV